MKNKKVVVFLLIIFLIILLGILLMEKFDGGRGKEVISLNGEKINVLDGDILTYNSAVTIACDNCFVDSKEVSNSKKLTESKKYKIKVKDIKFYLEIDKDIDFKIKDYFGNEIHNYLTNKLPFIIESSEDIKLDDKKYEKEGVYEVGSYKIKSNKREKEIKINEIEKKNEYNFYFTTGTLSTLYSALFLAKDDTNSYVWFARENTLSLDYLKEMKNVTPSEYIGKPEKLSEEVVTEVQNYIKKIIEKDKDAYFNVYVDEMHYFVENSCFNTLGFDSSRVNMIYITDGTISYELDYLHNSKPEVFEQILKEYKNITKDLLQRKIDIIPTSINYVIPAIKNNNSKYYLQYPSYFETLNKDISEIYKDMKFDDINPPKLYDNLSNSQKRKFQKLVDFNKKEFDENYFKESDKEYLIIIGNTPMDYGYGDDVFKNMIKDVVKEYKDKYNILFKPHPRALPDLEYTSFFENLGVGILPGKMPMEAITFTYKDLKLGGFPSSLFLSIDSKNMEFLFLSDKKDVFEPIQSMLDDKFSNVKIINPKDYK